MTKFQNFFKQIDEFLFKQIDVMLTGPTYQKFTDAMSKLEDLPQKILSQFLSLGLVFFPCIIVLVLFTSIWGAKTKVQIYKEILEEIQSAREKQTEINIVGANQISPRPTLNQQALEARLLTALNEKEKFSVSSFQQKDLGTTLKEGEAAVSFKNATMVNVSELFKVLAVQENFSVTSLEIRKNPTSNRLFGELKARQFGPAVGQEEKHMDMSSDNAQNTNAPLPHKLAERQLVDEIYVNRPWRKRQLVIIFLCTLCAFFVFNFPLKQTINSLVSAQIGKLPGCPFQYSSLDVSLFFFPSLTFTGAAIAPQVVGLPLAPRMSKLTLSLRRPSLLPPGILSHIRIEEGDSIVNLYPILSPFSTHLEIEDTVITEALLSQFLQGRLQVKGHVRVEGNLSISKQVVQKGQLSIDSEDLVLPAQRVAILELPSMEMKIFKLQANFDQGKMNITQLHLGQKTSPVEIEGQGDIQLNLRNLMASGLNMKLAVRFSPEFLENFAIIKLAMGGALPENDRYRFILGGQLGAPSFRPE